jgi:hypothetical protein
MAEIPQWHVAGDWFDVCSCDIACPCIFGQPPTNNLCRGVPRAEVPGKVAARAEALTGPMTPPGQRVQLLNAPGSEVGPGQVATWGKATTHRVDALGLKWEADGKSSKHIPFDWSGPQPS